MKYNMFVMCILIMISNMLVGMHQNNNNNNNVPVLTAAMHQLRHMRLGRWTPSGVVIRETNSFNYNDCVDVCLQNYVVERDFFNYPQPQDLCIFGTKDRSVMAQQLSQLKEMYDLSGKFSQFFTEQPVNNIEYNNRILC